MPFTIDLSSIGPFTRRYRRPLAATSAGLAVLLIAGARMDAPSPTSTPATGPSLAADEVAMPLVLASGAEVVQPGSIIDVVAVPELGTGAHIVARDARVLSIPARSGFASSTSATVVIAVSPTDALDIADASAAGTLSALIHAGP